MGAEKSGNAQSFFLVCLSFIILIKQSLTYWYGSSSRHIEKVYKYWSLFWNIKMSLKSLFEQTLSRPMMHTEKILHQYELEYFFLNSQSSLIYNIWISLKVLIS